MTDRTSQTDSTSVTSSPTPADPRPGVRLVDLAGLALLTLLLRVPAFLSPRHLTFDDGVFASSALAMREGGVPFRDVFSSQGPLFLPLVYLGDLLGFRTIDSPRVLAVVSGLVIVAAVYWAALQMTDRLGALTAGVLAATSGCLLWVTGPLAADGPALAFAALAFALALRQRDDPSWRHALLLGLAVGGTLSIKVVEAPILFPVALVLAAPLVSGARRRTLDALALAHAAAAAALALAIYVALGAAFGFANVWDQSVTFHEKAQDRDVLANAGKVISTLWDRDLVLLLLAAVTVVAAVVARRRGRRARPDGSEADESWAGRQHFDADGGTDWQPSGRLLVLAWVLANAFWLVVVVTPLWRAHMSAMVAPLALLIGLYRPPARWLAVAAVVSVPLVWVQADGLLAPGEYEGEEIQIVETLRNLPQGAWVLSDDPGYVWRAGRRTTDDLVDPSMLRVQQGRYTAESVAAAAADPRVCAVVVRSEKRFGALRGLGDRLAAHGYVVSSDFGNAQVVYTRTDCAPEG